jgi:hypothetical protein
MTAASLEQIAVDATFAVWGKAATYVPPGGIGVPTPCTVIRNVRDREMTGFNGRPIMRGTIIEVRKSEVGTPARGGAFTFADDGASFTIISDPQAQDPDRLVWTCTVAP